LREIIAQRTGARRSGRSEVDAEDIELLDAPDSGRGRTAAREIPLFGLLQRGDKVLRGDVVEPRAADCWANGPGCRVKSNPITDA